jgi:hypothetical protein
MGVPAVHDQVVCAAIADVGVTMQIIHGHAGILEPRLAERHDGFGGPPSSGVVDEHYVRDAKQAVIILRGPERRRERRKTAIEKREIGLIRDDADRQRYGIQGRRQKMLAGLESSLIAAVASIAD